MWTARLLVLASLFAPAAMGEFGSLEPRVCLCFCLCGRADVGMKTHLLHFMTGVIEAVSEFHPFAI